MEFRLYLLFYLNSKLTAQRCAVGLTDVVTYLHFIYKLYFLHLTYLEKFFLVIQYCTWHAHVILHCNSKSLFSYNLILQLLLNMFVMAAQ